MYDNDDILDVVDNTLDVIDEYDTIVDDDDDELDDVCVEVVLQQHADVLEVDWIDDGENHQ